MISIPTSRVKRESHPKFQDNGDMQKQGFGTSFASGSSALRAHVRIFFQPRQLQSEGDSMSRPLISQGCKHLNLNQLSLNTITSPKGVR